MWDIYESKSSRKKTFHKIVAFILETVENQSLYRNTKWVFLTSVNRRRYCYPSSAHFLVQISNQNLKIFVKTSSAMAFA